MPNQAKPKSPIDQLRAEVPDTDFYTAVVETPKGSQNKYKYEPDRSLFMLHKVLPAGAVFPYDFGFIPGTLGEDGDPLDVLILMDQSAFTGCVINLRLLGVIEAEQSEKGKTIRNDRLLAVAVPSHKYESLKSVEEMESRELEELEHFFQSYDQMEGKAFKPIGRYGPDRAKSLIKDGEKAYQKNSKTLME